MSPACRGELGIPVIETVAIKTGGSAALIEQLEAIPAQLSLMVGNTVHVPTGNSSTLEAPQREVRRILDRVVQHEGEAHNVGDRIDAFVLHPVLGYVILAVLLFLIFQAVFSWSKLPMDLIKEGVDGLGQSVRDAMPDGVLRSLLVDGSRALLGTG
jgi:ferrous iron transport protein B